MNAKKWTNKNYLVAYKLSLAGHADLKISQTIGLTPSQYAKRLSTDPALADAVAQGQKDAALKARASGKKPPVRSGNRSFFDFLRVQLRPEIVTLFDEIQKLDLIPDTTERARRKKRLENNTFVAKGKVFRQRLFLYALVAHNGDVSNACRSAMISRPTAVRWRRDSRFAELVNEVKAAMADYYENALLTLVSEGNVQATIFGCRTLLRSRGYDISGKEKTVEKYPPAPSDIRLDDLSESTLADLLRARRLADSRQAHNGDEKDPTDFDF